MKLNSELSILASLFNEKVYKNVKPILPSFPWTTEVARILEPSTCDMSKLNLLSIRTRLSPCMIDEELTSFIDMLEASRALQSDEVARYNSMTVFDYFKIRKVHDTITTNSDPSKIDKLIEGIKAIPNDISTAFNAVNLGELVPSEVIARDMGDLDNIFHTNFDFIRKSTPFGGYLPGQLVQWVAAPGNGKSAAMLYEIAGMAAQGHNILWVALGDLTEFDFLSRFTSVVTGVEFTTVSVNLDKYYTDDIKELASKITLITAPAGVFIPEQLKSYVEDSSIHYNVVVVDYDSNFKKQKESMYEEGGDVYALLTSICRPENKDQPFRLVFVACQPKVHFWGVLRLPEESAGESARKQQTVDMMITLGTANADIPCGIIALVKNRRGSKSESAYAMRSNGRFDEIDMGQLSLTRKYTND